MPYFSPSSANSDKRELYEKLRGAPRDKVGRPPHQGRWTRIGTAIGDVIQRDILFAERHYEKAAGEAPRFKFERTDDGRPMFEDFAKKSHVVEHNGKKFALYGTCDGILRYISEDGELLRVGLEVKSKQTTSAQTSDYSTRYGPKEDHVKQCVCYSIMYGTDAEPIDYYIILYVNASKKSWEMDAADYAKNPDTKAFGVAISDDDRKSVLYYFADVLESVSIGKAPKLDPEKFTFNNFKRACALSLTEDEYTEIGRYVERLASSNLPEFKKRGPVEAYELITRIRAEVPAP